ncbi:uncharacterized protein J3R85_015744 [Psidium guajava]|nr:uncharacterized protein J3R85_015744 [Psidium guajava]
MPRPTLANDFSPPTARLRHPLIFWDSTESKLSPQEGCKNKNQEFSTANSMQADPG